MPVNGQLRGVLVRPTDRHPRDGLQAVYLGSAKVMKKEPCKRDTTIAVVEPSVPTEFEVQAFLWHSLRALGVNVRGEVKAIYSGRSAVRFDLAVFREGSLSMIIEVKKSPIRHRTSWEDTRQGVRYAEFSAPVHIIYGMQQAEEFVAKFKVQQE